MTRVLLCVGLIGLLCGGCGGAPHPVTRPIPPGPDPEDVRVGDTKLELDETIYFASGTADIRPESEPLLDRIALLLINHDEVKVVHVVGHTDAVGDEDDNQELSENQAEAVMNALLDRGVTQEIDSRGMGERLPMCQGETEMCHRQNRRVDFFIEKEGGDDDDEEDDS